MSGAIAFSDIRPGQVEGALDRLMMLAQFTADALDDLEMLAMVHERTHSVGALLDPTAYIRGAKNVEQQAEILSPLLSAARKLAPIIERHRAGLTG